MSPTFRERQQQVREQAILDAAFDLLTAKGYTTMTMDAVATAVGISKATLYQHFPSKEELTVSVSVRLLQRMEAHVASLDARLPAIERLEQAMRWIIELRYRAEQRATERVAGGLVPLLRSIVSGHPRFRAQRDRMIATLSGLVDAAKAEGSVTDAMPTRILVQAMLSLMRDFDYAELLEDLEVPAETLSASLVAVFLNGVRRK